MYNCTCLSLCLTLSLFLSPHPATNYVQIVHAYIYIYIPVLKLKRKWPFRYTKVFSFTKIWNFSINVDSAHISAKPLTKIFVFVNTFENILNFCKNILFPDLFMSWPSCPLCPPHGELSVRLVKSVLSLGCSVSVVLSQMSGQGWPVRLSNCHTSYHVPDVLSLSFLSCLYCGVLDVLFSVSCPPVPSRLSSPTLLSWLGFPVLAVLSQLSFLRCPGPAFFSLALLSLSCVFLLSCFHRPVILYLFCSVLPVLAVIYQLSSLLSNPGFPSLPLHGWWKIEELVICNWKKKFLYRDPEGRCRI
jgi:hypothetical protein